jgi:hypothetical protein
MNERIHTLAEKAGLYCDGTPDAWDQKAIEKFAELIVQECAYCMSTSLALIRFTLSGPSATARTTTMVIPSRLRNGMTLILIAKWLNQKEF